VLPRQDDFFSNSRRDPGEKRTEYIFDSAAPLALEKFAAAMESILTPRIEQWHKLSTVDELKDDHEVAVYLDQVNDVLFKNRYASTANFASQQYETYMSLGAFGTGVLIVNDFPGRGLGYKSSHIGEHFSMENAQGLIDTNYRRYQLTAKQAIEKFGTGKLPAAMIMAETKEPTKRFDFIHCVRPNAHHIEGSVNPDEFKYSSIHVCIDGKCVLARGGFRTFPFIISRYVTSPNETYGRSPAMTALAEIKMVNSMRKTDLRARHLAVDPPILAANEQSIRRLNMKPNRINYGTLDAAGNQLVKPYQNGSRIDLSNDMIDQSHEIINDVFLVKLFQVLVDSPQMTATEVMQRAQEKGALLSPTAGRQQNEALGPMIEREIDLLTFSGMLPEMPEQLKEAGGEFEIRYTSPLTKLQKAEKAVSAQRVLEAGLPLMEVDPSIMDNYNLDEYVKIQADANASPAKLMRSDDEKAALREARAQQQQIQQMVEAAPQVSSAVKDIAQAQSFD
jgi:hypothetical protein